MASWMAEPSVTLPPALLMNSVIGLSFALARDPQLLMQMRALSFSMSR
jgi:hypothetical protein